MLDLKWREMSGEIGALMKRFDELPRYIAKKHLVAAVKRVGRDGIPTLKSNTPVGRKAKANAKGIVKMRRSGELRRSATSLARYKGRNRDGYVTGVLGYKYGEQSRKAIWLEFGTPRMAARGMVAKTMQSWKGPAASQLIAEMAKALQKATAELEAGINPGGAAGFRRKS